MAIGRHHQCQILLFGSNAEVWIRPTRSPFSATSTAFADLATYNDPNDDGNRVTAKIEAVKMLHADYSARRRLNLDGAAGTAADLAAFVAGWRYNNGNRRGTITSWKNGDVTHDGKTDVADFLRFRTGLIRRRRCRTHWL